MTRTLAGPRSRAPDRPALPYAAAGLLGAGLGGATGHLVAVVMEPAAAPVTAVGAVVVNATPTPVKEWAVRALGPADKPVLLVTVTVVTLLLAGAVGVVAARRRGLGAGLLAGLAGLAALAAVLRPGAGAADLVPGVAAAGVGVLTLVGLARLADSARQEQSRRAWPRESPRESPLDHTAQAAGLPVATGRRRFLVGAGGAGAATLLAGAAARSLSPTATAAVTLPAPAAPLAALPAGLEQDVPGISPLRTPVADFYRIDTALFVPHVDPGTWRLTVDGRVRRQVSITYADLLAMDLVERDITLICVSNEVGGPYIGSTRWTGVPVRILLQRAGIESGVDQILSTSVDGMTISTPVEALTDERDALLAVAMDGRPLPARHGFPVRLVTPGLYGFVGATKWLTRLTATSYAEEQAYWTRRDWATDAPVQTQARIDTPSPSRPPAGPGRVAVGGVAWSQARGGISRVEVQVDDGPWQQATLGPAVAAAYWRQWFLPWDATAGTHRLTVRATDGAGATQTERTAPGFPSGATGYHSVEMRVG